jgi:protein-disulfide isomerase
VAETPTFFINGRRLLGSQPLTTFRKIVDGELAKKTGP